MERMIYIKTQFEGFHSWKDAPEEVAFLRNSHRHIFHIQVTVPVNHDNREIEFFMMKQEVQDYISHNINKYDVGSCEMIAEQIAKAVQTRYERQVMVDVSEDNENGAIVAI